MKQNRVLCGAWLHLPALLLPLVLLGLERSLSGVRCGLLIGSAALFWLGLRLFGGPLRRWFAPARSRARGSGQNK